MAIVLSSALPKLVWFRPADDLWVATSSSRFAGEIRERSESFWVSDRSGRRVGDFPTLARAMNALRREDHLTVRGILRHDGLGQAAVAIGLLTLALAIVAVPVYFR